MGGSDRVRRYGGSENSAVSSEEGCGRLQPEERHSVCDPPTASDRLSQRQVEMGGAHPTNAQGGCTDERCCRYEVRAGDRGDDSRSSFRPGRSPRPPLELLQRHQGGDWGELDKEDRLENEYSAEHGYRILSAYTLPTDERIRVVTDAERSSTGLLLPSDYCLTASLAGPTLHVAKSSRRVSVIQGWEL